MKKLILFVALFWSITTYAQSTVREEYCSIEMPSSFYGPKKGHLIAVDYGDATAKKDKGYLKDKEGKYIEFYSTMQVVNYMGKEGWALHLVSPTLPAKPTVFDNSEYSISLFVFKRITQKEKEL